MLKKKTYKVRNSNWVILILIDIRPFLIFVHLEYVPAMGRFWVLEGPLLIGMYLENRHHQHSLRHEEDVVSGKKYMWISTFLVTFAIY